jgi:hypothetical protein
VVGTDLAVAELKGLVRRLGDGDSGFGVESAVHVFLLEESVAPASVAGVLLVNGLTADLQHVGDRLPAPALLSRVADLHRLEAVGQRAERSDGGESLSGISARRGRRGLGETCGNRCFGVVHCVK